MDAAERAASSLRLRSWSPCATGESDLSADWARFSDGVCGAKLHIVYDCDAERQIDAAITPARLNDLCVYRELHPY